MFKYPVTPAESYLVEVSFDEFPTPESDFSSEITILFIFISHLLSIVNGFILKVLMCSYIFVWLFVERGKGMF